MAKKNKIEHKTETVYRIKNQCGIFITEPGSDGEDIVEFASPTEISDYFRDLERDDLNPYEVFETETEGDLKEFRLVKIERQETIEDIGDISVHVEAYEKDLSERQKKYEEQELANKRRQYEVLKREFEPR